MVKLGLMMKQLATLLLILLFAAPARAAQCGGAFTVSLPPRPRAPQAPGSPRGTMEQASPVTAIAPPVLAFDRGQHGTSRMSFERSAATRVTEARLQRPRVLMARHA